ncbi:MAG: DUF3187 family protein [Holophaga sp.]|nr:DUF3187 family protein [Holophaga sp.]
MKIAVALLLALSLPAWSQDSGHLGPAPTRDQFPINLETLTYIPAAPDVLAAGAYEADLQWVEANTFEFSDVIKHDLKVNPPKGISLAQAQQFAAQNPQLPLIFFFQMETSLTTLRLRAGLGGGWEGWMMLPVLSYSSGFEDGLIDWTHRTFGFNQEGRSDFPADQVRVVVVQNGAVTVYSDHGTGPRVQDPVAGLTRNMYQTDALSLAVNVQVKPPLTRSLDRARAGWDSALQFTGRWTPNGSLDTYFGAGVVHRQSGNLIFNQYGFRDQLGLHAMVEGWRDRAWRPFLQLVYLTGSTYATPGDHLDKPSLQHDLGVHWLATPNLVLTLRYMNNITNNENTADMALILEGTWRFGKGLG